MYDGVFQTCIYHDGLTRCWYTYIPETAKSSSEPIPLVIDMHGYNKCAVHFATYSGWSKVAQSQGFVVIWPQGNMDSNVTVNTCWSFGSCCCFHGDTAWESAVSIDDIGFLQQAIANTVLTLKEEVTIDTRRIYFSGHSNGCVMAQAMAALKSDLVAAVCCHGASHIAEPSSDYRPTSVHVVHGNQDKAFRFNGTANEDGPRYIGAIDNIDFWGKLNGCLTNSSEIDSSNLFATYTRSDCLNGTKVELVEVFDAGHYAYLGVKPNNVSDFPDAKTTMVDTTSLSWQFCSQFESEVAPPLVEPVDYVSPDTFIVGTDDMVQIKNKSIKKNVSSLGIFGMILQWMIIIL